ncbi:mandelate racemase/muconate lactonizing enzyme family protein [Ornithinimicrobium sp. Y1847]|uniref:mandelate racemase/muconate lactonizing enzyme family protein n=1 Tax=Ornithinimicrobium sp. Y1847 TaxID=3405419 RepID=UPI003B67C41D
MRIERAVIHHIHLPLRQPFVISYARWEAMPSVVVELHTDDGLVGWGEGVADEFVTGETTAASVEVLEHVLLPEVLGHDLRPAELQRLHAVMAARIGGNPSAKAAIDIAFHDLLGQQAGLVVCDLLGGRDDDLTYPSVISIGEPEEMAAQAERALSSGFSAIKIKVGQGEWRTDVARIRAVCEAVDHRAPVRVDVNQGWSTPAVAIQAVRELGGIGVAWVEEPIAMGDIAGLAEVRRHSPVPIMADESCQGPATLLSIIAARAADLVNIKVMKTAGLHKAAQMAGIADAAGVGVQIGSMVESSVASAAGFHLAAARTVIGSTELTGPLLFSDDIGDLTYTPPRVHLPTRPGLGVNVDLDALERLRITRREVVRQT